jgi:RHS repeat-associated protein
MGNQVYGPYGSQRYTKGAMGTAKGFTGQYNDSVSGLDYYNARYYDPTAAVFLSVDTKQGNLQGMNPYDYVGGNPETKNDPTGQRVACPDPNGCNGGGGSGGPVGGGGGSLGGSTGGGVKGGGGTGGSVLGDVGTLIKETEQLAQQAIDPNTDPLLPAVRFSLWTFLSSIILPALLLYGGELLIALAIAIPLAIIIGVIVTILDTTQGADSEIFNETPETRNKTAEPPPAQAGGGGQRPSPDNLAPTAPSPDQPPGGNKSRPDLFRMGNASGPRVDHVRLGQDVFPDENNMICEGGISTFEQQTKPGKWWKLPADAELPEGLQFRNDKPGHWLIEPSSPISLEGFQDLLRGIEGWRKCF